MLILTIQDIPVRIGQVTGKFNGIHRVIFNFRNKGIQTVKQEMRVQLVLQGAVAGLRRAFLQLFSTLVKAYHIHIETVQDKLPHNHQLHQPDQQNYRQSAALKMKGRSHACQCLGRHQQQIIGQKQDNGCRNQSGRQHAFVPQKIRVIRQQPLINVAHAQSHSAKRHNDSQKRMKGHQPVL